MEAGINVTSDARLQAHAQAKVISPELAMRELIQKRKQAELHSQEGNARNATNDPDKSHAHLVGHLEGR